VQSGWNVLVGTGQDRIMAGLQHAFLSPDQRPELFGNGSSAQAMLV
jgi:hypothetical protein